MFKLGAKIRLEVDMEQLKMLQAASCRLFHAKPAKKRSDAKKIRCVFAVLCALCMKQLAA